MLRLARMGSKRYRAIPYRDSHEALCTMWAEVRGQAQRAGPHIETADAWIAATALLYNAELVTHNAGDFDFLSGLRIITEA